jgi:S-formylglutathione hydrolase FrmB
LRRVRVSRRALLGGGAAVVTVGATGTLVEYDVLPGRSRAYDLLGLTGAAGEVPDVEPGPREDGTLASAYVDDPAYRISYPPGSRPGDPMPVVVALHGAGRTAESWCDELSLDVFLAASGHRMAVAAVDGGLSSYWHARDDGSDPQRMLLEEFLPMLGERGLAADRPGLLGWSMGGLGALMLGAELAEAGADVPVLAVSPALWPSWGEVATDDAFDSEDQYDGCMALARTELVAATRVDCGTGDPFYRDVRSVLEDTEVEQHYAPGAHAAAYWGRVLPGQLDWLAARLSAAGAQ